MCTGASLVTIIAETVMNKWLTYLICEKEHRSKTVCKGPRLMTTGNSSDENVKIVRRSGVAKILD